MRIYLAQINTTVGDIEGNCAKIVAAIEEARRQSADVALLPELAITGYPPRDLLEKGSFVRSNLAALERVARAADGVAAVVGFVEPNETGSGKGLFNAAAWCAGGQIVARARKRLLPTYDVFDEDRHFEPGKEACVVDFAGARVGVSICEDAWTDPSFFGRRLYGVDPLAEQVAMGAELLLNLSASPYALGRPAVRERLLSGHTGRLRVPLVYVNLVGGNDELLFDGRSYAYDAGGRKLAELAAFREDAACVDVEVGSRSGTARVVGRPSAGAMDAPPAGANPANGAAPANGAPASTAKGAAAASLGHAAAVTGAPVTNLAPTSAAWDLQASPEAARSTHAAAAAGASAPASSAPQGDPGAPVSADLAAAPRSVSAHDAAEVFEALVMGTRDYAAKCSFASAVIGLSGGIDSSVVAVIAAAALGPGAVTGVSMPSRYSSPGSREDAAQLAANLGIGYMTLPIEQTFAAFLGTLADTFRGRPADVTEENLQARIRGMLLMALSNKFGWLVLTTGNKSEMAVGYSTLYGDMSGGLAVISDVPKTLVYGIGRHVNTRRLVIPPAVFSKPPSAELRAGQCDQDSLPPYDVLDGILRLYVEEQCSARDIAAAGYDAAIVRDVVRRVDRSEYKRKQAPPGLRITSKAFGLGRRMPIAQRWSES